ncbi:MAG: hypothetical protein GY716_13340 [bacterium]|nr:hypothetical protein [bacterium]
MRHYRIVAALTLLLCAGCAGPGRVEGDDAVRVFLTAGPASLSLIGKTDLNAEAVAAQISDGLVQYDPDLNLIPALAEAWEFSNDRLTLTFRLRENARWHDGNPVTARDVVFTIEKVRDPRVESRSWAPLFHDLESVEAVDDRTVRARYARVTPDVLAAWRVPMLPEHLAGRDADLLTGQFASHPIGCGPYRFVSYAPDQEIVLEANDDHWNGRPKIDRLIFKIYPDERTGYQALLSGGLDVMNLGSTLFVEALTSERAAHLEPLLYDRLGVWGLFWNQDGSNPFFGDARVRKAMALALDRETFIDSVIHGHARPGATTYHPDSPWTDASIESRPYDPQAAARLLDEAGWRDTDGDGVRDKDGRRFEFTLMTATSVQKLVGHMAVWQQESWNKLGLNVSIEQLEWQAFRERRNAGRFQALSMYIGVGAEPDQYPLYHSSATDSFNFYGLNDPEIDRLVEDGRTTFETENRLAVYRELQQRLHEVEPLTSLFYFTSPVLRDKRLAGLAPSPVGLLQTSEGPRAWHWTGSPGEG